MKNFLLLLLSLLPVLTLAQTQPGRISGSLTDSTTTKPVAFATIALQNADGNLLTGVTSDDKGRFTLDNVAVGTYKVAITFVGYRARLIPGVLVTAEKPSVDLGSIRLATEGKTLGAVDVVGQKALIEDKGDRLVYNAEKDIANAGGTAADVLRKVPMLTVDLDGNLKMRGSSNIKVLVNGKPSSIMARNLADALKQMPANVIKSVEVITSPGAKYDAEGSAGVVNIITKKALKGTNGTTNLTAGNLNRSVGLNLNARGKKLGFATSLNGYQYRNINDNTSTRTSLVDGQPTSILFQQSARDNTSTGGYGNLSLDYDPDSLNRISLSANAWGGNYPQNSQLYQRLTDPQGAVLQEFRRDIKYHNPYGNTEFNLGWTRTYTMPGREFSILTQYARMPDNYFYDLTQMPMNSEAVTYRERGTNYSRNKEYTFQTDYVHPFTTRFRRDTANLKLEIGAKTIRRDIGSEFAVDASATGQPADYVAVPGQGNDFTYNQQVTAGYASLKIETKHKWNLTTGLRLEHTGIRGDFVTTQTQFDNAYNNLIPSFILAKTLREKHTLKASYTQRISRPMIWYLNPFRNTSDPKNITTGNPYLNPELTHATELSYSRFGKDGATLNAALYWRQTNNSIEFLTSVDPQGVATSTFLNIGRNASYGLNLNGTLQPNKNFNVTLGSELTYIDLSSVALNQRNSGLVASFNTNLTYKLPHEVTLQANGFINSGWVQLQGRASGWYYYGVSAKREFWGKNASLTLNVNNPFNYAVRVRFPQSAPSFRSEAISHYVNRSVRLTFSYKFGQMSAGGRESRKISNDDSKGGGR